MIKVTHVVEAVIDFVRELLELVTLGAIAREHEETHGEDFSLFGVDDEYDFC